MSGVGLSPFLFVVNRFQRRRQRFERDSNFFFFVRKGKNDMTTNLYEMMKPKDKDEDEAGMETNEGH